MTTNEIMCSHHLHPLHWSYPEALPLLGSGQENASLYPALWWLWCHLHLCRIVRKPLWILWRQEWSQFTKSESRGTARHWRYLHTFHVIPALCPPNTIQHSKRVFPVFWFCTKVSIFNTDTKIHKVPTKAQHIIVSRLQNHNKNTGKVMHFHVPVAEADTSFLYASALNEDQHKEIVLKSQQLFHTKDRSLLSTTGSFLNQLLWQSPTIFKQKRLGQERPVAYTQMNPSLGNTDPTQPVPDHVNDVDRDL